MNKICLGEKNVLPILDSFRMMRYLICKKDESYDESKIERICKIFVDSYCSENIDSFLKFGDILSKNLECEGIDGKDLRMLLLADYMNKNILENIRENIRRKLKNVYIDFPLYSYFEKDIKRVIVFNMLKRMYDFNLSPFLICIYEDIILELVNDDKEKFKKEFMLWARYNVINECIIFVENKKSGISFYFDLKNNL